MKYRLAILMLGLLIQLNCSKVEGKHKNDSSHSFTISYFQSRLTFQGLGIVPIYNGKTDSPFADLYTYYYKTRSEEFEKLTSELLAVKDSLQLNDWMFFSLVSSVSNYLYVGTADSNVWNKELFNWAIMSQSGYNVHLLTDGAKPYIYFATNQLVYNMNYVQLQGQLCVQLRETGKLSQSNGNKSLLQTALYQNPDGKIFDFNLNYIPYWLNYPNRLTNINFEANNLAFSISLAYNHNWYELLSNYPRLTWDTYLRLPNSEPTTQLLSQLESQIKGMSLEKKIRFLLSFTRTGWNYKSDQEAMNIDNWLLSPDEMLIAKNSDCEDRSLMFLYLCKKILNVDGILLTYPDHMTVGIYIPGKYKNQIKSGDKIYTICEPTGPQDFLEIGEVAPAQRRVLAQILGE
ncbi:MAG: hypothetical protein SGJ04_08555 [Bacteroidota bacterium]|nr:hypothetical protein [Bacteroidota bacterium]